MVDPSTVCQYTGLTDRKENKIFEGDIVELVIFYIGGGERIYKAKVIFNEFGVMFEYRRKNGEQELLEYGEDVGKCDTEVIGNIFDGMEY